MSPSPAFFFHLKLELYPVAAPATKRRKLSDHHHHHHSSSSNNEVYVPPTGSNIFKSNFPVHKRSTWTSYVFEKKRHTDSAKNISPPSKHSSEKTEKTTRSTSSDRGANESSPPTTHPQSYLVYASESHGDALLLPERSLKRPTDKNQPTTPPPLHQQRPKPSNEAAARDWRYDSVSIECIDMAPSHNSSTSGNLKSGSEAGGGGGNAQPGLHTKAVYLPSDPTTTEVGWGVVHLYRDTEESARLVDEVASRKSVDNHARSGHGNSGTRSGDTGAGQPGLDVDSCTTLSILAVPSWMMPSDLLGFVGDQAREDVSHFRLIRTGRANKYMVLMKFRSAKKAREWQKAYNGRLFSAAEPENCHVVFIKSVEFITPDSADVNESGDAAGSFPRNNHHDPFVSAAAPPHGVNGGSSASTALTSSKPLAPPPPNLLELPTCPVCLERMDETTGLLTILCQHVFHCACLEKWRFPGSGCPVCRYTQNPSYTFPYPRPQLQDGGEEDGEESEPLCSVCATHLNLWICLICGNIGCGRYDSAHAFAHYEATSHCYAMDVGTQRVWDYAGDGYVHRLIQSKPFTSSSSTSYLPPSDSSGTAKPSSTATATGTELSYRPRHANEAFHTEPPDTVPREKMESMANEYTYLLTSQLEGQRRYFEEQVERAADKAALASARADEAAQQATSALAKASAAEAEFATLSENLAKAEKQLEKAEKTRAKFETMAREFGKQLSDEKSMNKGLLARVKVADEKVEGMRKEVEELKRTSEEMKDMNHDLQMFISSQEKVRELQAAGEEVEDGSVSLPAEQQKGKKGKGRKK